MPVRCDTGGLRPSRTMIPSPVTSQSRKRRHVRSRSCPLLSATTNFFCGCRRQGRDRGSRSEQRSTIWDSVPSARPLGVLADACDSWDIWSCHRMVLAGGRRLLLWSVWTGVRTRPTRCVAPGTPRSLQPSTAWLRWRSYLSMGWRPPPFASEPSTAALSWTACRGGATTNEWR